MAGLAAEQGKEKTVMIDATYPKAHFTASSMGAIVWPVPVASTHWMKVTSLHKLIRHVGSVADARMEIRVSRSS